MATFWHALGLGCLVFAGTLIVLALFLLIQLLIEGITDRLEGRRQRRIARIEAELDAKAADLHRTILAIAGQLADERGRASQEMSTAASLVSRKIPPTD